ncbi:FtsX-like permease family protein [Cellulomonas sp. PhB150]|uniref:FtsX-like permease family protein n=1 Tax=Cellulomonas sp. PhB150 TaxID=2485188 RepID=UPI000F481443|nr:FtsX-like permease family protein [Cellulomonas sp. PhB150]ROS24019.1 FtsX-like permease family protein [Cellulomonas sp. PhB150]
MGELVRRRARAQLGVLAAVLAVMVAGAALVGVCVALTTAAPQRALQVAVVDASAADVQVGVALGFPDGTDDSEVDARVTATAQDPSAAVAQASALLTGTFGDLPTTVTTWSSTIMQYLPVTSGPLRLAYLADLDVPDARGTVVAGRWPTAPGEVALPVTAAKALGLDVGSSTTLAAEPGGNGSTLTLVGTFTPRPGAAWEEDPLTGSGTSPNYRGFITAYGPFVVAPGALATSDVPFRRVALRVQPDLAGASAADVARAGETADALSAELTSALGDRAQNVVVDLPFAHTLDGAREQRGVTSSGVLAVALLGASLAATAVLLAARMIAARRAPEAALLVARGASRGRLVAQAAAEAGVLVALCVVPATALALGLFHVLSDAVGLGPAGITEDGLVPLVVAVTAVAVTLGALLVLPWLRTRPARAGRDDRIGVVARSGTDLLLLAFAVLAYLQLRDHGVATGAVADPVLVVGPVLFLLAGAALALRLLPILARRADARATAARSLALPLAAWGVARRPQGTAAAFLVVLATACATFGVGFAATWAQSQRDQAAATVGTDLAVAAHVDTLGGGAALRAATGGRVSAVTSRPVTLGSRALPGDEAVRLVAVDTRDADELLRGRLPSGDWAGATAGLAPPEPLGGVLLTGRSADVVVAGHVGDGLPMNVSLSIVVQDATGAGAALPAGVVALDGARHRLTVAVPPGARVVAVDAHLTAAGGEQDVDQDVRVPVAVDVTLLDATLSPGTWSAAVPATTDYVAASLNTITSETVPDGVRLRLEGTASLPGLYWSDGVLTALAFDPVEDVPVVVSQRLADELGLAVGDGVQLSLGVVPLQAKVRGIVAYVPSQPRAAALLADTDTLSRAALSHGSLGTLTDAWWVGGAIPATAVAELEAQGVGPVTARAAVAHESVDGPLRAAQRAAIALLVVAALVLAIAGTALHSTTALDAREVDVARLRGLGASRRTVRTAVLAEQGVLTGVPILAGALLGALACWAVGPLLAISAEGLPPVPAAVAVWPWPALVATVFALLLGCAAVIVPLAARAVRRATMARLRMDAT